MKAYVAFKFKEDYSDRPLIEAVTGALERAGIETRVMVRDQEAWGAVKFEPRDMMRRAFAEIDACDILVAEFSEKGVGLGIEAGYAYAKGKPVYVIAREGSEISETLEGIAKQVIFYTDPSEIKVAV